MGGEGKLVSLMTDNLLHLKVNTIVVVLIATTIPWLSVSVQGLPTDQAENQLGSLSAPEEALVNHHHCNDHYFHSHYHCIRIVGLIIIHY